MASRTAGQSAEIEAAASNVQRHFILLTRDARAVSFDFSTDSVLANAIQSELN